jgi:uncharacterized membrane protein
MRSPTRGHCPVSHLDPRTRETDRTDALVNGALIAVGTMAVLDNVVAHWLLGLHRAVPGPWAGPIEVGLVVLGTAMVGVGLWREWRARAA